MAARDRFAGLHPAFVPWALWLVGGARTTYTITSTRRSATTQARLYREYLAGRSPYPAAPPGRSWHQLGLAWDMVAPLPELRRLGAIWRRAGGIWGGEADPIHFQATSRMLRKDPPTR